jgi:hypothetical protein
VVVRAVPGHCCEHSLLAVSTGATETWVAEEENMRDIKYHPKWDLFPFEKLYRGKSVRAFIQIGQMANDTHTKKNTDDWWFRHKKYQTLILQQATYLDNGLQNISERA